MRSTPKVFILGLALTASLLATGCVPLLIGGTVGTAAFVSTDRRTTGAQMADEVMEKRINYEITQAITQNLHLTVTSYNRRVLLTGEVGSQADKIKASNYPHKNIQVILFSKFP